MSNTEQPLGLASNEGLGARWWVREQTRPSDGRVIQADVCAWDGGATICTCDGSDPAADAKRIAAALTDADAAEHLKLALIDAIECVDAWSLYASAYFQEKHDLAGDLRRLRGYLERA